MASSSAKYQDPFRPAYEAIASFAWLAAAFAAYYVADNTELPPTPFRLMSIGCALMVPLRFIPALRLWSVRGRIMRPATLDFISPNRLFKNMKKNQFWLGNGFVWTSGQTAFAHKILSRDAREIGLADSLEPGSNWIHMIGPSDKPVYLNRKLFEGQTLVVGTTGSGKTRLMELLIVQCVAKGHGVVIIDPKSDTDLRASAQRACHLANAPEKFAFFNPAFPETSARIDPMRSWNRSSELANRIASLIPSQSQSDPWKAFSQRVIDTIVQGMIAANEIPTLMKIRSAVEGGLEALLLRTFHAHFNTHLEAGWEAMVREIEGSMGGRQRGNRELDAHIRFYQERVRERFGSPAIEGLMSMYEHDASHFGKMISSLLPILSMLTSGHLGQLLSPIYDPNDPRPILDVASIINDQRVLYMGLDSLSDGMVGSALGSIFLADLTAAAGDRYNFGSNPKEVFVFVDEASEVATDTFIQLLNKSRGSGIRVVLATQTFADFAARLGDTNKARQVLANCNNLIALRVIDSETQEYISEGLIKTKVPVIMENEGQGALSDQPLMFSASYGSRISDEEADLFPSALLGQLPNLHYVARLTGGALVKGRLPILKADIKLSPNEQIVRNIEPIA